MKRERIENIFSRLAQWSSSIEYSPIIDLMASSGDKDPFKILVSTMLSSRTKDEVTAAATRRIFDTFTTPAQIKVLSEEELRELIYPVGFFKTKARNLKKLAAVIDEHYGAEVPATLEELTSLPGVGVKTATLVFIKAFDGADICVDTHVHRITNMWGLVSTKSPEKTRDALKKVVPRHLWSEVNHYLVTLGQLICKPRKQLCRECPVEKECPAAH